MSNVVGIRELRQQASAVLRRVAEGESLVVADHGHPVARIVPLRPSALEQLVIEGRATQAEGDLLMQLEELGLPAEPAGAELPSSGLDRLRAEEA